MTIACAIGVERREIDEFFERLQGSLREMRRKREKAEKGRKKKEEEVVEEVGKGEGERVAEKGLREEGIEEMVKEVKEGGEK